MRDAFFVAVTIFGTVYGQLIIKWRVGMAGSIPDTWSERFSYLFALLFQPWVVSVYVAAVAAAVAWMLALSSYDLSRIYPFVALSFALVLVLSAVFFDEPLTATKVAGVALILAGLVIGTRG